MIGKHLVQPRMTLGFPKETQEKGRESPQAACKVRISTQSLQQGLGAVLVQKSGIPRFDSQ